MSVLPRLLGRFRPSPWRLALAVLLGLATIAANTGLLAVAAYVIVAAARSPLLIALTGALYLVRFFGISRAFLRYAERLVSHDLTFRLLTAIRGRVYRAIEPLAPGRLEIFRSGDLLTRLVADVEELEALYQQAIGPLLVAALVTVLTVVVLDDFSRTLALVAVATLLAAGLALPLLARRLSRGIGRRALAQRADLQATLVESVQGVADLLAAGAGARQQARVGVLSHALARERRRAGAIDALESALGDVIAGLGMLVLIALAIPLVRSGRIDGAYLAALGLLLLGAFEAIQPLGPAVRRLGHAAPAAERLFEILDAEPDVLDPPRPTAVPMSPLLAFERVRFAYRPGEPPALDDVSFILQPGSRVAVVGPSGAGKSTLVHLAVRFADPQTGHVSLGGDDLRAFRQEELRARIAVVAQNTHLFNDTLRGNLLLARPDARDDELIAVVRAARLEELVARLPRGLETWVGEHGQRLSGGERQRLAIARALLKNAPLLILDEPTANLDTLTEREVLDALHALITGRTTLMITHRLLDMDRFDEILVLEHGRIVQRGRHADLATQPGLYRRLLRLQDQILQA